MVDNKYTLLNDLGNNMEDDNIMPMTGVLGNLQPDQIDKIPVQINRNSVWC